MKSFVLKFLLIIMCTISVGTYNLSYADEINQNMISNPSVEDTKSNFAKDWFKLKIGKNNAFFSNRLAGKDTQKSISVNVTRYTNGLNGFVFKPVEIEANTHYDYSEYYKSGDTTYVFLFYITDSGKVKRVNLGKVEASKEWKKLEYNFKSPIDAKKLTILHFIKTKGILVSDNFSLTKSTDTTDNTISIEKIETVNGPTDCNYLSVSQNPSNIYNSTFTCDGKEDAKDYKIEIFDSKGVVINTISDKKGTYIFKNDGNYTARCLVSGETTAVPICQKSFSIKAPALVGLGSGGGGGGGGGGNTPVSPLCTNLESITGSGINSLIGNFSCTGNASVNAYKIDILDASGSILKTVNSNNSTYEFPTAGTYTAKCYVNGQIATVNACQKTVTVSAPPPAPTCNDLTFDKYTGTGSFTSNFACNGNSTSTSYKIDILDGSGSIIHTANTQTGSYLFETQGNYTAKCYVNDKQTTSLSCEKTISVNTPPPAPECTGLTASPDFGLNTLTSTFNCSGNSTATSYKIDILNNLGNIVNTINTQSGTYFFNTPGVYTAKCYVNSQTTTPSICQKTVTINEPTPPPPPPTVDNIIPNPSLETVSTSNSSLPQSWNSTKIGESDAQFTYLDSGFTGNKSLQVKITSNSGGIAFYYFDKQAVEAGVDYDFSMYYKSDVTVQTDMEVTTASGTVYKYIGTLPSSVNWTQYTTSITMPPDAVSVTLYTILNTAGTLVTDDYSLSKQPPSELNKAIITLTFDDYFSQSFYDTAYQSFKNHNMAGSMYLVGDYMDPYFPGQMSREKLIEMRDYGMEIGSHTVTHAHLPLLSQSQIDAELIDSKNIIEQFLGTGSVVDSIAVPYGEYNDLVISRIKNVYSYNRITEEGFNNKHNFDKYLIKAINPVVSTTPESILAWVDEAIAKKAWLVIVYHDILDGGEIYSNTPAHLEAVMSGLDSRRAAGLLDVKTTKDALSDVLGQIQN
ncbi:MAG: polysaccharide deacetylase family protein [Candidatus Gracilibacteria bacterium]|nr:polysaccharide deacetylase family protein [Candidatus Gracilibacteria bacterium]